jgi:hypothetical protein
MACFSEVKTFGKPPRGVFEVCWAVGIILGDKNIKTKTLPDPLYDEDGEFLKDAVLKAGSWKECQKMFIEPQKFLEDMQKFVSDGGKMSKLSTEEMKKVLAKIEPVLESDNCTEERLRKKATMANGLRGYIHAIADYYKAHVIFGDRGRTNYAFLTTEADEARSVGMQTSPLGYANF